MKTLNRIKLSTMIFMMSIVSIMVVTQNTESVADLAPPTITNVYHTPTNITSSDDVIVNCNVTDDYSGVASVKLFWKNMTASSYTEEDMTCVACSWYQFNLGSFAAGTGYKYYIKATDNDNNEGIENNGGDDYFFEVEDTEPPQIGIIVQYPDYVKSTDLVKINITSVNDTVSGVKSVNLIYRINEGSWQTIAFTKIESMYQVTIGSFSIGDSVQYYVEATDNDNNTAVDDNSGSYYSFIVQEESTPSLNLYYFIPILSLGVIAIIYKRKR